MPFVVLGVIESEVVLVLLHPFHTLSLTIEAKSEKAVVFTISLAPGLPNIVPVAVEVKVAAVPVIEVPVGVAVEVRVAVVPVIEGPVGVAVAVEGKVAVVPVIEVTTVDTVSTVRGTT
jgi:hypothetical protein